MKINDLVGMTLPRLREIAKERKIRGISLFRKKEMIAVITENLLTEAETPQNTAATVKKTTEEPVLKERSADEETATPPEVEPEIKPVRYQEYIKKTPLSELPMEKGEGMLDIMNDGFGFLRCEKFKITAKDIYISASQIHKFKLRQSDMVAGLVRSPKEHERYPAIAKIESINGEDPKSSSRRPLFRQLTPVHPFEQFKLETAPEKLSTRIMDILIPVGKGQRGLIVSPPKAGKTVLLKEIANSISSNYPETELIILLIDERPEEVTDMKRSVNADVVSSTFDEMPDNHIRVAELAMERALRLVELGRDVVVLMDSISRLTRSYNLSIPPSGRTLSGGIDPGAFYKPKRFFGAARKLEDGGSLTIIATALVETGSRMDDVIYEEFKGTGNMELHLDRKLANKRIFPSIDIALSGTRREELLLDKATLELSWVLRRSMSSNTNGDVLEKLFGKMKQTRDNAELLKNQV